MSIYDFKVKARNGGEFDLSSLRGKVVLIVNTATGCGFTPQYEGLEKLYEKYRGEGFEVLDFPCDQFGHQAPGSDEEIHEFCTGRYKTTFERMSKIDVNGENEIPLYTYLKAQKPEEEVRGLKSRMAMKAISKISNTCVKPGDIVWNFTKFLVAKDGTVAARFDPTVTPEKLEEEIKKLI